MRLRLAMLLVLAACSSPDEGPNIERRIEVVQAPEEATPGFPLAQPVVLRVLDGDGSPLPGQEVTFTASDGGSATPERAVSGVDGLVLVNWRLGIHPGRQVLSASAVGAGRTDVEVTASVFRVTAIDAGFYFGCGLAAGEVWCWGRSGMPFYDRPGIAPQRAMPDRQLAAIAAADFALCGLDPAGAAWCRWQGEPAESQLAGPPPLSAISAGDTYFCGISATDRTPWCWTREPRTPAQVSPTLRLASLSAGGTIGQEFACGIDDAGDAWCWGAGGLGQLGDGNAASSATPVRVAGGLRFRELSSGGSQSCGIVDGDNIYCWGSSPSGAGMPSSSLVPAPFAIRGVRISLGFQGGLATAAGTTTQWGGGNRLYFAPPQVLQRLPSLERLALREVSADDSMCGMTADGLAYCSADVFVNTFSYTGPQWLPVPEPGADVERE